MSNASFFSKQENIDLFSALSTKIKGFIREHSRDDDLYIMLRLIGVTASFASKNPDLFDERCPFNVHHLGDKFAVGSRAIKVLNREELEDLFVYSYRFLIEFQINTPGPVPDEIQSAVASVVLEDLGLQPSSMMQVRFAEHQMLIGVIKQYLHHSDLVGIKELPGLLEDAIKNKAEFERDFALRKLEVDKLKVTLGGYRDSFNFVGLFDGFRKLRVQKFWERLSAQTYLAVLGMAMVSPFAFKLYVLFNPAQKIFLDAEFYFMILGFELLLMYFFRVGLQNLRSIKAQLLQIDLRMTLCQFVQSYAVYITGVREKDSELLVRFEQIIFSGIVSSDDSIPSSFDGVDQLAKLISTLKNG